MKQASYEFVDIEKLVPYVNNQKKHPVEQIEKIAGSIKEFGFINPIIIDKDNVIIAGHGRYEAAKRLGLKEVPILRVEHLSQEQVKAYRIADNKLAELAEWDEELLAIDLSELESINFDFDTLGFDKDEVDRLLDKYMQEEVSNEKADEIPEVEDENVVIKQGDLIELGEHRLLCGDSFKKEDVEKLMQGEKADMVFTDPPYDLDNFDFITQIESFTSNAYVFIMSEDAQVQPIVRKTKLILQRFFILDFGFASPRGNDIYQRHILLMRFKQGKPIKLKNLHDGMQSIIRFDYRGRLSKTEEVAHPHQKPASLVEKFILHHSDKYHIILDLFGGSGSTLIACEITKRKARLMEIEPKFCQLIIERWCNFTGNKEVKINNKKANWEEYKNGRV